MQIILSDFISLDGVSQAPGGPDEDTDGGFAHGGWSGPYFDPETMGANIGEVMARTDALLFGRRTWDGMAAAWPGPRRRPVRRPDELVPEVRRVADALGRRGVVALEQHDAARRRRRRARRDPRPARGGRAAGSRSGAARRSRRQLVEHDLVDEYQLMLEPILLGGGKSIFPADGRARPLELVSVHAGADRRAHLRLPARLITDDSRGLRPGRSVTGRVRAGNQCS